MERVLSVKQISNYIAGVFDDELILHDICVAGEIFEFKVTANSTFIVLKEDDFLLDCYKFGRLEAFQKGEKVTIRGRIRFYPKSAKVSLNIAQIRSTGEGKHHADFLRLKERLNSEGLFDNKITLPLFIKRVAIITSAEGAVIHDFMSVLCGAHDYVDVDVYNVSVQGTNATSEITAAIANINNSIANKPDVIVVARGGGSFQDLMPFNSEEIARSVFGSLIPIISAVGHETDYTLCDFCASYRAPTPSLAADCVAKINQAWLNRVHNLLLQAYAALSAKFDQRLRYVTTLTRKLAYENQLSVQKIHSRVSSRLVEMNAHLARRLSHAENLTVQHLSRLNSCVQKRVSDYERAYSTLNAKLDALSPLKLLAGGYAKVTANDVVVRSVAEIEPNQTLMLALKDGTILAKAIEIRELNSKPK